VVDYQFLGMVAVILAVATRGSVATVVVVTAFIGLVTMACETAAKWYRRRHPKSPVRHQRSAPAAPGRDLNRWMTAVERILGSHD